MPDEISTQTGGHLPANAKESDSPEIEQLGDDVFQIDTRSAEEISVWVAQTQPYYFSITSR